jgi:hypothetical protein
MALVAIMNTVHVFQKEENLSRILIRKLSLRGQEKDRRTILK